MIPPADPKVDLHDLTKAAIEYADQAARWYTVQRRPKKRAGMWLRYLSIIFLALSGLVPVIVTMCNWDAKLNLWASLLVGIAGLLIAIDRFAGHTRGWIRYIQAHQRILDLQNAFVFRWRIARSKWPETLSAAEIVAGYEDCRAFVSAVADVVREETNAWAAEFQNAMQQFDLELQKAKEARQAAETREIAEIAERKAEERPGAIQVVVSDVTNLAPGWKIIAGKQQQAGTASGQVAFSDVPPGLVRVELHESKAGAPVALSAIAIVKPNELTTVELKA